MKLNSKSKKYAEQLKLAISCIKNKLSKTSKEFKEFKFQQNLRIEFTKNDKDFKNKIFSDPRFGLD